MSKNITEEEIYGSPDYNLYYQGLHYEPNGKSFNNKRQLTVAGLRNIRDWASWKSSSLGEAERLRAERIQNDGELYEWLDMNEGKRSNVVALLPDDAFL